MVANEKVSFSTCWIKEFLILHITKFPDKQMYFFAKFQEIVILSPKLQQFFPRKQILKNVSEKGICSLKGFFELNGLVLYFYL